MKIQIVFLLEGLLIPALMILSGRMMKTCCAKKRSFLLGYRTRLSGKSQESWTFANRYCGGLYEKIGWWSVPASILYLLCFLKASRDTGELAVEGLLLAQCALLLLPILPTQRKLREKFGDPEA